MLLSSFPAGQLEKALGRARSIELRPGVTVVTDAESIGYQNTTPVQTLATKKFSPENHSKTAAID